MAQVACGIDIGGSGVKGALVDLETGEYIGDQVRIPTPRDTRRCCSSVPRGHQPA